MRISAAEALRGNLPDGVYQYTGSAGQTLTRCVGFEAGAMFTAAMRQRARARTNNDQLALEIAALIRK
jgi:hypothetical protein